MIEGLKLILNDYCEKVVPSLFKYSANISAKRENIVSYPTHIINAVFTAASIYAYEHLDPESENRIKELRLLIVAITLHDVGKYLEEKYGISGGNSKENIKKYFENDDFRIKKFFPEIENMVENSDLFDEIAWLVQNTELKDESRVETNDYKTEYGKLADYSRLGDKIASLTRNEFYPSKIFDALKYHDTHIVQIPKFSQFLLRRELLKTLKEYYEERGAIPFLLYEDGFFYIHKDVILPELKKFKESLLTNIRELMNVDNENQIEEEEEQKSLLNLRIDFQSIDDNSILNFPISKENKKKIIQEQIIRNIPNAMKGVTFVLPRDKKIQKKLATIIYYLYKSKDLQLLNQQIMSKIELLKKPVEDGGVGPQKYKIFTAKELLDNYRSYDVDSIYSLCDDFLDKQLNIPKGSDIIDHIINNISFDFQQVFEIEEPPMDKDELCFLCGSKAQEEYRAGRNYFLQARGFSKRGKMFDFQKKICSLCLIERSLIEGLFRDRGYTVRGNYLFGIFYFDRVFANVSYFSREFSNISLKPETPIIEEQEFRLGDFDGLYFIKPYLYGGKEESAKQSNRVNVTKQILDFIYEYGCKAILTFPYTLLRTYNELFINENPMRLEMSLGICSVYDFYDLNRKRQFLNAIYEIDKRKGYFNVYSYELLSFIRFIKIKSKNLDKNNWIKNEHVNVVRNCFGEEIMKIEEIAQKGRNLYSNVWGSSYKRTVLMRTALDTILVCLQQQFSEEETKTFVSSQIYKLAMREEYAKKKDVDKYIEDFVFSLIQYLEEKSWFSVHSLSSLEKYIIDAYEFALLSVSKEE